MHIVYIDKEQFYGREFKEQGLIILFKRINANDTICKSYCQDVLHVITTHSENLYVSDIIKHCEWIPEVREVIEQTLYIRKKDLEEPIWADSIKPIRNGIYDELLYENKRIAKIQVKRKNTKLKFLFSSIIVFLCIAGILKWHSIAEENRTNANQDAYNSDVRVIDSLSNIFQSSVSDGHSYVTYMPAMLKSPIANSIDSLRNVAKSNLEKVRESGDYSPVILEWDTYITSINELVEKAKDAEQLAIEAARIEENKAAIEKDQAIIEAIEQDLYNAITNQFYSDYVSESQVQIVRAIIDSLYTVSETSRKDVENSGHYNNLVIDSEYISHTIQDIVNTAKAEYYERKKPRTEVIPVRPQRDISSPSPNNESRYDNFVKLANKDYDNYFMTRDIAAAGRAINNYNAALKIKNNSKIANRRNILKKELGL